MIIFVETIQSQTTIFARCWRHSSSHFKPFLFWLEIHGHVFLTIKFKESLYCICHPLRSFYQLCQSISEIINDGDQTGTARWHIESWINWPTFFIRLVHAHFSERSDIFIKISLRYVWLDSIKSKINKTWSNVTFKSPPFKDTVPTIGSTRVKSYTQIAKFMGPTWGPPGSCRPQMGPMLAPWTLLSGYINITHDQDIDATCVLCKDYVLCMIPWSSGPHRAVTCLFVQHAVVW